MLRLASTLYSIIGSSLAGALIVVALVTGYDTVQPILIAALIGFTLGIPVSWGVAKALMG
ncbi:CTP synthetase [Aestuariibius sp. HNIBRBA575]|uniref:CTP synthetase n=1 Tax=Aestuariibius sp. HNIBRBA575 TaxID=3233343 RepID=UPI0034A495CE